MMTAESVDVLYPHDVPVLLGAYEALGRVTCFAEVELRSSDLRKLQLMSGGARI